MSSQISKVDPRIESALDELRSMIQERWPNASFKVAHGEDPEGIYLDAIVDIEDTDEVMDLVVDRLLEFQIEDGLPVYVIPVRPPERAMEGLRPTRRPHGLRRHLPSDSPPSIRP